MSEQKHSGDYRIETDSMGELKVPTDALWGAQTQRAVDNFPISGIPMSRGFIRALGLIKAACAEVNADLGLLDAARAGAIVTAAEAVAEGQHDGEFPIDVFQTGSGTSSNMNANEVIAHLAAGAGVHPNDHVNMGQSSNDVIPTAIHVAACLQVEQALLPAMRHLAETITRRAWECEQYVKTGRTHLMDAMPVRLSQELGGWAAQVEDAVARIESSLPRLRRLALGGTAVGTGINAHPQFGERVATRLTERTGIAFETAPDKFKALSSQDDALELSGQLKAYAAALMKVANDLRWMNSGPLAGLAEIALPSLQPGSSIMPGKVNPVIPEATAMVCAQVIGNDTAITLGAQSGNFQLNVMLPVIAHNLLQSLTLLASASQVLADKAIAGFVVNEARLREALAKNPILVTALNPVIGYELGAKVAKRAYAEGRPLLDVALEETDLDEATLRRLLDPARLTEGGISEG
ncbi:MAG: class II fumarate hydratase [Gammaproteobacteria bacterium]|nr:class II fumarate hydratase [Gammaproteobacteria bacterium]MDX5374744.1 class II fumarate hydratase [Gammaproteobacteria bacterium]